MQKIAIILTLSVISFLQSVQASGPASKPTTPSNENGAPVSKKAWMENIQDKLPNILCEKDQYFMKCFSVTQNECVDFNKLFVQACLNNVALALPAELNAQESKHWGAVMGKCSFDLFEKFVSSKKQSNSECNQEKKKSNKDETQKPSKKE